MKVAVIIKHPYRYRDWRIDIFDVPEDYDLSLIRNHVEFSMLGPFEVQALTTKINFDRKLNSEQNPERL